MDGSFFVVLCRRSERAGLGVHEIVDHVENMDGFKLLPGAEPRQMRSRGAVVGKRRDHRDRFPFPIQPLLAQNAIRIRHSCRAVRLVERISIRAVRRVSCFRRANVGEADAVLERQLSIGLADIGAAETEKIWIAYEPVWAIGVQGKPITFAYADERLYKIRQALNALFGEAGEQIPIFYGGSVNPGNALELAACREINGLFIGRSAWDAEAFNVLIRKVLNR